MVVTPDQARELLDGTTPGPWEALFDNEAIETDTSTVLCNTDGAVEWGRNIEHDVPLAAASPDLAQTIAGMTEEWGVRFPDGSEWWPGGDSEKTVYAAKLTRHVRFIRRLVSVPVVIGE